MPTDPAPVTAPPAPPRIHEAEREPGASGAVLRGAVMDVAAAVARRRTRPEVVSCGPDAEGNRRLAYRVESAVGPCTRPQAPHRSAGPMALPHLHQLNRSPDGHTFYETDRRKAKKQP